MDEVQAMMGGDHNMSMAEMQTSMNTRSPGPTNRSNKLQMNLDNSSILPAESNYGGGAL